MASPADFRREYARAGMSEEDCQADPIAQFAIWFDQALSAEVSDPNAMTLATADASGNPAARIVLFKNFDERGFVFYTNYESPKGQELLGNPAAALVFYWPELERQVRVVGKVERTSREESEAYFRSRPRGSQLGAHVSKQGQVIADRSELEESFKKLTQKFEGKEIPLPDYWGGFRVIPKSVEFWQGRISRLHDRIRYRREADRWIRERLFP